MKLRTFLLIFVTSIFFISCSIPGKGSTPAHAVQQPQTQPVQAQSPQKTLPHAWFYFSGSSFFQIDTPNNAPQILKKPWTESVRISSSLSIKNESKDYDVYFTVNRAGLLIAKPTLPKKAILAGDIQLFSKLTAGSLVCVVGVPVFHTYKTHSAAKIKLLKVCLF